MHYFKYYFFVQSCTFAEQKHIHRGEKCSSLKINYENKRLVWNLQRGNYANYHLGTAWALMGNILNSFVHLSISSHSSGSCRIELCPLRDTGKWWNVGVNNNSEATIGSINSVRGITIKLRSLIASRYDLHATFLML